MDNGKLALAFSIYDVLAPVITALLGWVAVKITQWIRAKTKNEYVTGTLLRLNDAVFTAVRSTEQTLVREIKAAKAPASPGGTKLTSEEAVRAKEAALAEVRSYWGIKGLQTLAKILGLDDVGLGKLLAGKLEAAVHDLRGVSAAHP